MCHGRLGHIQALHSKGRSIKFLQKKLKFSWIKRYQQNLPLHKEPVLFQAKNVSARGQNKIENDPIWPISPFC